MSDQTDRMQRYAPAIRHDAGLGESWGVIPEQTLAVADAEQEALRAELAEFEAKKFASMSRINRAERVAEAAVLDKQAALTECDALRAEVDDMAWQRTHAFNERDALQAKASAVEALLRKWENTPALRRGAAAGEVRAAMAREGES